MHKSSFSVYFQETTRWRGVQPPDPVRALLSPQSWLGKGQDPEPTSQASGASPPKLSFTPPLLFLSRESINIEIIPPLTGH